MKPPVQLESDISQYESVTQVEYSTAQRYIDFRIGPKESFPKHRATYSRVVYDTTSDFITNATLRVKSNQHSSYTGSGDSLAETLQKGVKIAVIDSVIHIYLTKDVAHRPRIILRILTIINSCADTDDLLNRLTTELSSTEFEGKC